MKKPAPRLICNARGEPKALLANAISLLRDAPAWNGVLAFDTFSMQTMKVLPPPWEAIAQNRWEPQPWQPHDDIMAANWMQGHDVGVGVDVASQAVEAVARDREVHPVADYLESLEWDGVPRIDSAMSVYFGAQASPYSEAIGRVLFVSGVARVVSPGCKADQSVILEGAQGTGKSMAVRTLFDPWFSDEIADLGSKDAAMQCAGVWAIEIAELDSMSRAEVSRVKAFLTRTTDRFRPPYGRRIIEAPRQCIFVGTTNQDEYLKDETGNRRFLPIRTGRVDTNALARDRHQLWAEAVTLHANDAKWWLVNPGIERRAQAEQRARLVTDPWEPNVASYIGYCGNCAYCGKSPYASRRLRATFHLQVITPP